MRGTLVVLGMLALVTSSTIAQASEPRSRRLTEPSQIPDGISAVVVPSLVEEVTLVEAFPPRLNGAQPPFRVETPVPRVGRRPAARQSPELSWPTSGALDLDFLVRSATLGVTFDSIDYDSNAANNGGSASIPADPYGAAGPDHVLNVTNTSIRFHQKDGTLLLDSSLADFFAPLNPLTRTFDPKTIYDQHAGRFLVLTMEQTSTFNSPPDPNDTSRILLAVSDDSDPQGAWYFTEIASLVTINGEPHWADYPGFGVDRGEVYITATMFPFDTQVDSFGVRLWYVRKGVGLGGFYDGGAASLSVLDPYQPAVGGTAATTQPGHVFGLVNPDFVDRANFLVSYSGLTDANDEQFGQVILFQPIGPAAQLHMIPLGPLETNPISNPLPDAPQMGSVTDIETNDRRALNAVWQNDRLWWTTTIDPALGQPDSGQATAHWIRVNTENRSGLTLDAQGSILAEDIAAETHTFYPAVAVNRDDEAVIGFSASASSIHVGSYYLGLSGGISGGSDVLRAGTDTYVRTFGSGENRWGDYSSVAVDPVDQCFWIYNKHAIDSDMTATPPEDGRWGTAWGKVCPPLVTCSAPDDDLVLTDQTVSGTETFEACISITAGPSFLVDSTGNATFQAGSRIILRDGFSVASGGRFKAVIALPVN